MFIGSTASRVIRKGDIPVLVVSRKAGRTYRRPLVAVDLEDTSRAVVDLALRVLGPEVSAAVLAHAGTHGRSGISHALVGSVAEWVIENATVDVLVARPARVSFELP